MINNIKQSKIISGKRVKSPIVERDIDYGPKTITFTIPKEGFSSFSMAIDKSLIPADGISFYVMRIAKVIVVHPQGDFFIGRSVKDDSWDPQVNLAELDGFAGSVSRRHAMIRPVKSGYEITDLLSTNGTKLDDRTLIPNQAYPLMSGMQMSIGREVLMVLFRSAEQRRW